ALQPADAVHQLHRDRPRGAHQRAERRRRPAAADAARRQQRRDRRRGADDAGARRLVRARAGRTVARRGGVAPSFADAPERAMSLRLAWRAAAPAPSVLRCRAVWIAPVGWLALQAAALWPHGLWIARRMLDGSDDPLGIAAAI